MQGDFRKNRRPGEEITTQDGGTMRPGMDGGAGAMDPAVPSALEEMVPSAREGMVPSEAERAQPLRQPSAATSPYTGEAVDKGIRGRDGAVSPFVKKEQRVGKEQILQACETLRKYKDGKSALEARLVENEKWYRVRQWDALGHSANPGDPEPTSAWLFNSLANKHADAMDNLPSLTVLPREEGDRADARALSGILPAVLEQTNYEQVMSDMWWYKLRSGTGVMGAFWDPEAQGGIGDISIRSLDLLNLFWQPGVTDIQKSRDFFHVELCDREVVKEAWPEWEEGDRAGRGTIDLAEYAHDDTIDTSEKVLVVDWYYKRRNAEGQPVLHYCKFCGDTVLYASENDENYAERGYYDHGKYPFVFDVLFPVPDSPAGVGYVDVCKSPQIYIDKLDQALLKNTIMGSRPRHWVRDDTEVNVEEYADMSKDFVHYSGSGNPEESIFPISVNPISMYATTMREAKITEIKETSGNRDFSQGGTASGVTAASAVAALQEAGSKLSRDMIKASYRAFAQLGYLCIELIRQFYEEPRQFRIIGHQGETEFATFSGQNIQAKVRKDGFMESTRLPYFDIRVIAEKASPFSTVAQNERAKELYGLGFFRPDLADQALATLEMMQFDGIEQVRERISQNQTMYNQLQQIGPLAVAMAQQLDMQNGTSYAQQVAQIMQQAMGGAQTTPSGNGGGVDQQGAVNSLGASFASARNASAGEARKRAASAASV